MKNKKMLEKYIGKRVVLRCLEAYRVTAPTDGICLYIEDVKIKKGRIYFILFFNSYISYIVPKSNVKIV